MSGTKVGGATEPGEVVPISFSGGPAELLAALGAGHPGARAAFFDRYVRDVERVLMRVLGPDGELPDIVQDVFLAALENVHRVKDPAALQSWLLSIAVYTARHRIRSRSRRRWLRFAAPEELPEMPVDAASPEDAEAVRATWRLIQTLPVDERIAFCLRYVEGMELTEVARACDVSLSTIKRRLARAQAEFARLASGEAALSAWLERGDRWTAS